MRKSISNSARAGSSCLLLAAAFWLAITFTLSCSPSSIDNSGLVDSSSSNSGGGANYNCQLSSGGCIQTVSVSDCSQAGGSVVDICQFSPSSNSGGGVSSSSVQSGYPSSNSTGGGNDIGTCIDGTVTIGTQTWQKCNLNVVPSTGKSSCYDNDPANCSKYGRLYDWAAAKSACPSGWHLPSQAEWDALKTYIERDKGCSDGCDAGYLRATSGSGWSGNIQGVDSYGFSALPGGGSSDGNFSNVGSNGYWWSSSEYSSDLAYRFGMIYGTFWNAKSKSDLYSVRCLNNSASNNNVVPSSASVYIPPSSSSNASPTVRWYCDCGPINSISRTETGGGCFEMESQYGSCDTEWCKVANSCGRTDLQFCDFGQWAQYVDENGYMQWGGGCFRITGSGSCDTQWGTIRSTCPWLN